VSTGPAIAAAVSFVWLGMVLAISFLEAPLKFRAPNVTLQIGLGIGRLVFRALNTVEGCFALLMVAIMVAVPTPARIAVALSVAVAALAVQLIVVRPRLTPRSDEVLAGADGPRSRAHYAYIGLEAVKAVALLVAGTLLLARCDCPRHVFAADYVSPGGSHPAQVASGDDALGHRHQRPGGLAPPRRGPRERRHLGEYGVGGRVAAYDEAFLARLRVARQRAVAEPADVGFVDDVDHPARRGQEPHPHHHHRADGGDLGAGAHPQARPALHAPAHDGVGGPLETFSARPDLALYVQVPVARGQPAGLPEILGRPHLGVGEREFLERW